MVPPGVSTSPAFKIPGEPVVLTPAEKALGYFLKAQVAIEQGDQDTALQELEQAVASDPDSPFLRLRLATLYVRKGKVAEALEHCQRVVAQEPDNDEAQLLLAGLLSSTNREEEAAKVYEAVLTRAPKSQEPKLFKVVLMNDDYSTMEFVVQVLETVFRDNWAPTAKLYYTLDAMGVVDKYQTKVYEAIHKQSKDLNTDQGVKQWAKDAGIQVSDRGRIPASVVAQYHAATSGP